MVVTALKLARVVAATVAVTVPVVKARKVATSPKAIVPAFTLKFLALRSEIPAAATALRIAVSVPVIVVTASALTATVVLRSSVARSPAAAVASVTVIV